MLAAHIDQEIFMLAPSNALTVEEILSTFSNVEDLNRYLEAYSEEELEDMRVLHGYLTRANIIPSEFHGVFPYIIAENPEDPGSGFVSESEADVPEELAEQMEKIIDEAGKQEETEYDIDDFYILYGYEISLQMDPQNYNRMCIAEFDVNDIQINDAKSVVRDILKLKKKHAAFLESNTL